MKKNIILILTLGLIMSACGSSNNTNNEVAEQEQTEVQQEEILDDPFAERREAYINDYQAIINEKPYIGKWVYAAYEKVDGEYKAVPKDNINGVGVLEINENGDWYIYGSRVINGEVETQVNSRIKGTDFELVYNEVNAENPNQAFLENKFSKTNSDTAIDEEFYKVNKSRADSGLEENYRDDSEKDFIYFKATANPIAEEWLNSDTNEYMETGTYNGEGHFSIKISAEGNLLRLIDDPAGKVTRNPIDNLYIRIE